MRRKKGLYENVVVLEWVCAQLFLNLIQMSPKFLEKYLKKCDVLNQGRACSFTRFSTTNTSAWPQSDVMEKGLNMEIKEIAR